MPLIDENGRLLRLVNVIDLLAVLLAIAVVAAGSSLALSSAVAGPLTAVIAVASSFGLVLASKWYHDVEWGTVTDAARDARPSLPSQPIRSVWNWLTAEPDPDVIVIDLRETLTVGPIIVVLDLIVERLARLYRGSAVERVFVGLGARLRAVADRTGLSTVVAKLFSVPDPPESDQE
ncbi:MAG: DUF4330 family protein [Halobacteriales archaeon]